LPHGGRHRPLNFRRSWLRRRLDRARGRRDHRPLDAPLRCLELLRPTLLRIVRFRPVRLTLHVLPALLDAPVIVATLVGPNGQRTHVRSLRFLRLRLSLWLLSLRLLHLRLLHLRLRLPLHGLWWRPWFWPLLRLLWSLLRLLGPLLLLRHRRLNLRPLLSVRRSWLRANLWLGARRLSPGSRRHATVTR
jgi:hypothetical protein